MVSVGCVSDADPSDRLCGMIPLGAVHHGVSVHHRSDVGGWDQVHALPHEKSTRNGIVASGKKVLETGGEATVTRS